MRILSTCRWRNVSIFGGIVAFGLWFSLSANAGDVIFSDDFQGGLENWMPDAADSELNEVWTIVSDPDVADENQKVLCTPKMGTQLYFWHSEVQSASGTGLLLTFRFNADQANRQWNTTWTLFKDPIRNGAHIVSGYSVGIGYSGTSNDSKVVVSISRDDPNDGSGERTVLVTADLPEDAIQPGWNRVQFLWEMNGSLKVSLNDSEVLVGKDTSYEPSFRTLGTTTWISNNLKPPASLPDGRKLFFDDTKVESIDR